MDNVFSEQQIAEIQKRASAFKMLGNLRNPKALIESMVPQNSPIRSLINGDDYDTITVNILKQAGYDPEKVQQQLASAGIV